MFGVIMYGFFLYTLDYVNGQALIISLICQRFVEFSLPVPQWVTISKTVVNLL